MSTPTADGSEDVSDFLERIKEIGKRRDQEDEERNRKLEEDIIQGKKERQARRAERARSISPTKSSPANTPTNSRLSLAQKLSLSDLPLIGSPGGSELSRDISVTEEKSNVGSISSLNENGSAINVDSCSTNSRTSGANEVPEASSSPTAMLSKSPTLLWKRRLSSQVSNLAHDPSSSTQAIQNLTGSPKTALDPSPKNTEKVPRNQTDKSLIMNSPSWLQQSSKGESIPKHRRALSEYEGKIQGIPLAKTERPSTASGTTRLELETDETTRRSTSIPSNSLYSHGQRTTYGSTTTPLSEVRSLITSPNAFSKLDSPIPARGEIHSLTVSPIRGRISPERLDRSTSPTKGMGGFVQSAMMKRSDSVNKRWSVQSSPGLNRVDSVSNNRDTNNVLLSPMAKSSYASRETSPDLNSKSRSNIKGFSSVQESPLASIPLRSNPITLIAQDSKAKPLTATSHDEYLSADNFSADSGQGEGTSPASPSKNMDRRRWSPTKSSWLEAALNKQEPPKIKPKAVALPQQPTWVSEINKLKQKSGVGVNQDSSAPIKHEVMADRPAKSSLLSKSAKQLADNSSTRLINGTDNAQSDSSRVFHPLKTSSKTTSLATGASPTHTSKSKSESSLENNLRANLKPRKLQLDNVESCESEFKSVFVKLRPTKTQNYVAPDEFKNNITRGKAALNLTNGPQKTERKDEFKEAILKKKEDFKKSQLEGKGVTRSPSTARQGNIPEALLKREALARKSSTTSLSNITNQTSSQRFGRHSSTPNIIGTARAQAGEYGRISDRVSPELAALIGHRPSLSSITSNFSRPSGLAKSHSLSDEIEITVENKQSGAHLTHLTKERARGPRRKPPTYVPIHAISSEVLKEAKENIHLGSTSSQAKLSTETITSNLTDV
ncbi:hypothetical protein K3495_g6036 [Podosphaera aphanis]|nr:hypothetical protein K3495_g6036 [Podosphaera aphanis]